MMVARARDRTRYVDTGDATGRKERRESVGIVSREISIERSRLATRRDLCTFAPSRLPAIAVSQRRNLLSDAS